MQVGMVAINDGIILESCIYRILKSHFKSSPYYTELLDLFHEVKFMGCSAGLHHSSVQCGSASRILLRSPSASRCILRFMLHVCVCLACCASIHGVPQSRSEAFCLCECVYSTHPVGANPSTP